MYFTTYLKGLLIAPTLSLLVACVTTSPYPLNMTETQWNKLSPAERQTLLLEQQKQEERYRLEHMRAEQLRLERQHRAEQQAQLEERRRLEQAHYPTYKQKPDIIYPRTGEPDPQCVAHQKQKPIKVRFVKGQFHYNQQSFKIEKATYRLNRGETKKIQLALHPKSNQKTPDRPHKTIYKSAYLKYAKNGQAFYLYLRNPKRKPKQKITLFRNKGWHSGQSVQKELHSSAGNLSKMIVQVKQIKSKCGRSK